MTAPDAADDRPTPDEADAHAAHEADRPPTPDEEAAADAAAEHVDPASGKAYQEANERGANVAGEGEIVPDEDR